MKKKPVSFEEKRQRMMHLFHEKKICFNLKDLEKECPKRGIVLQSVKEVLESLISDDLVESDKIGAGNFYWSFPSKSVLALNKKITAQNEQKIKNIQLLENLENQIQQESKLRIESDERFKNLRELNDLTKIQEENNTKINKFKRNDPDQYKINQDNIKKLKEKINLNTDNLFEIKKYFKQNFYMQDEEISQNFEIPIDLEYV